MDPNAALAQMRQSAANITASIDKGSSPHLSDVEQLTESTQALDGWISNGGFLPTDWEQPT